jgi:hypothetical protein
MERAAFIDNIERFIIRKRDVEACFRISKSLPERVFNERLSYFRFQEFDWAMSAKFWPSVQTLCQSSGDASILIAVLEPDPLDYYKKEFGYFNWAELPIYSSSEDYWNLINNCPDNSPADSLLANSEKVVWFPPSRKWAIWGERSLEVCVLGAESPIALNSWNGLEWALETGMPNAFARRILPAGIEEMFRKSYGVTT